MKNKIRFLTGNQDKLTEARSILGGDVDQLDIDLAEIQHIDPKVVIESKLNEAQQHHDGSFIVEDTSLSFDEETICSCMSFLE